ncbi:MAG TPA: hypothetical protein VHC49_23470, partial [Mycobacteriales bacterium]|nr:hypothetical protein [Mycobacteriales bacterium]
AAWQLRNEPLDIIEQVLSGPPPATTAERWYPDVEFDRLQRARNDPAVQARLGRLQRWVTREVAFQSEAAQLAVRRYRHAADPTAPLPAEFLDLVTALRTRASVTGETEPPGPFGSDVDRIAYVAATARLLADAGLSTVDDSEFGPALIDGTDPAAALTGATTVESVSALRFQQLRRQAAAVLWGPDAIPPSERWLLEATPEQLLDRAAVMAIAGLESVPPVSVPPGAGGIERARRLAGLAATAAAEASRAEGELNAIRVDAILQRAASGRPIRHGDGEEFDRTGTDLPESDLPYIAWMVPTIGGEPNRVLIHGDPDDPLAIYYLPHGQRPVPLYLQ